MSVYNFFRERSKHKHAHLRKYSHDRDQRHLSHVHRQWSSSFVERARGELEVPLAENRDDVSVATDGRDLFNHRLRWLDYNFVSWTRWMESDIEMSFEQIHFHFSIQLFCQWLNWHHNWQQGKAWKPGRIRKEATRPFAGEFHFIFMFSRWIPNGF